MWPVTLSGRLLIVALVGRYPANWLIRRGSISHRWNLWQVIHANYLCYAVLAVVSNCCPPVWGRLSTRYSPVRHSDLISFDESHSVKSSFDLHVLSTPPAFILSQDQTLIKSLIPSELLWPLLKRSFRSPFTLFQGFCSFLNILRFSKQKPLRNPLEFSGLFYCSVIKEPLSLSVSSCRSQQWQLVYITILGFVCQELF